MRCERAAVRRYSVIISQLVVCWASGNMGTCYRFFLMLLLSDFSVKSRFPDNTMEYTAYSQSTCEELRANTTSIVFFCQLPDDQRCDGISSLSLISDSLELRTIACPKSKTIYGQWSMSEDELPAEEAIRCRYGSLRFGPVVIICKSNTTAVPRRPIIAEIVLGILAIVILSILVFCAVVCYCWKSGRLSEQNLLIRILRRVLPTIVIQKTTTRVQTLADLARAELDLVPRSIKKLTALLEQSGMEEGVYRISDSEQNLLYLDAAIEANPDVIYAELDPVRVTPCTVAASLKRFLKALPEPVIPHSLQSQISETMAVDDDPDDRKQRLRLVLSALPKENRSVLRHLILHLQRVAANYAVTKMNMSNLARNLWPTLLRPDFESFDSMELNYKRQLDFVELIFWQPELLDEMSVQQNVTLLVGDSSASVQYSIDREMPD